MALDYLAALSDNRTNGPDFAATAKPVLGAKKAARRRKAKPSLTKRPKRAKLPVKRSRSVTGKRKVEAQTLRKSGKLTMAKAKKAKNPNRVKAGKRAAAKRKRQGLAVGQKNASKKSSGKRKNAKRVAAGKKAARTRKRHAATKGAGRTAPKRKAGKRKAGKRKGGRRAGARSSSRSSHRSNTRIVKQTIVKHVPTGGLLVQAPRRKAGKRKARKGGKCKAARKGKRKGARKSKGHAFKRGAMENPMTTGELILGGFTGLLGFLTADVVDRMLATHALTDKGTKDLQGNELYADNPPSSGDYTGLYNATAICAPMDVKRWLVGVGAVAGLPLVLAHFVKNDMARSGLQFFGFAAGVRIVGKGLTDLVAGVLKTNAIGQQLYDGEMRAAALKANNGNQAATALASLPSAGLGQPGRLGAAAPCAPCATGAGYPSNVREVASAATQSAPPQNSTPSTQMAPPPAPPPPPPAPAFPSQVSTLTGVPSAKNRFNWGHDGQ